MTTQSERISLATLAEGCQVRVASEGVVKAALNGARA